ncbi:MAG TPA: AAA family ATPase [Gemmatimonadales bacterium]|nr:AAA family ATPase [Gemmatimonadales bacterium]
MRTIAVVNQKGGCGKTITSINLSAFLALAGRRVLLVDMDPQGHSTLGLSVGEVAPTRTMYDVFRVKTGGPEIAIADITRPVGENLDLAPADILLSTVPETITGVPGRENVLTWAFARLEDRYDYIIVDCPPSVGLLTFNALKACSEAIVPMDPSFFSLHGIGKLLETFEMLEKATGHRIAARVLITLYSGRSPFVKAVVDEVHRHLPGQYFETVIRYSVKLAEAASHGLPVTRYARESVGYEDYRNLAKEVLTQEVAAPPAEALETLVASAPYATAKGVVFTLDAPEAKTVQIAADFNNWNPDRTELERVGAVWKTVLPLDPGRYRYRYVIDGTWVADPMNPLVEPSLYSGNDSLFVLEEPAGAAVLTGGVSRGT